MPRFVPVRTLLAVASLACAPGAKTVPDSAAVEHDPSLHAQHASAPSGRGDSSFAALQARGATGMGVDQYTSTHTFEPTPTGGRITLRRKTEDSAGVEQIRAHLRTIASSFAAGDFTTPAFVHAGSVPGTDVMVQKRGLISYRAAPIAGGAELVMMTADSVARDAIHRFLAFQRKEHRAGDGTPAGTVKPATDPPRADEPAA